MGGGVGRREGKRRRIPQLWFKVFFFAEVLQQVGFAFQMFQSEIDEAKAKEDALERKRQYEENVRLGLMKKKGRKSKAQLEKERKEEKRRRKRERKAERRRRRKERCEREGVTMDPVERKLRKERREKRRRERKERRRREREERERMDSAGPSAERKKIRRPKDPNAIRKPRQPVRCFVFFFALHAFRVWLVFYFFIFIFRFVMR